MRLAEDQFLQDLFDAEYDEYTAEADEGSDGEAGRNMHRDRRLQAERRTLVKSRMDRDDAFVQEMIESGLLLETCLMISRD